MSNTLLTNRNNIDAITTAIRGVKKELRICSAWIRSGSLNRMLGPVREEIRSGHVRLRVLIRLGETVDVKITDPQFFNELADLGSGVEIRYYRKLHAKFFLVDETWAAVGSFNLTGGGFGDERRPGSNVELGLQVTDAAEVKQLADHFDELWQEAEQFPHSLAGFILDAPGHQFIHAVGLRPLEVNRYFEVREADGSYLLARVIETQKLDPTYFHMPETPEDRWRLLETFGVNADATGLARGVVHLQERTARNSWQRSDEETSSNVPGKQGQIHLATLKVEGRVLLTDSGAHREMNRVAPDVGAELHIAGKNTLSALFKGAMDPAQDIAHLSRNPEVAVLPDLREICSKHMAVFGTTGSGKSHFVKRFLRGPLYQYMVNEKKGRLLILDPHGEYRTYLSEDQCLAKPAVILDAAGKGMRSRFVETVDDLLDVLDVKKVDKPQRELLTQAVRVALESGQADDLLTYIEENNAQVKQPLKVDWRKQYQDEFEATLWQSLESFKDLAKDLFETEYLAGTLPADIQAMNKTDQKMARIAQIVQELFNKLPEEEQKLLREQVYQKRIAVFEKQFRQDVDAVLTPELVAQITNLVEEGRVRFTPLDVLEQLREPGVYVVDFAGLNEPDARWEVAEAVLTAVFNEAKTSRSFPTLCVVEEAHNFAPEGGDRNNPAAAVLKRIAMEGRKFDVGLLAITQRPANVSKSVLAQCGTQAIFRLVNDMDLKAVESCEGIGRDAMQILPMLDTGSCMFTGLGLVQPVEAKVVE